MPSSENHDFAHREYLPKTGSRNLPVVTEVDAPMGVQAIYSKFREDFGSSRIPGILQCFATHPPLLEHMIGLAKPMLFSEGALGRRTKEMIATYISSRAKCEYCADSHGFFLRMHGGSADLLAAAMACDIHAPAIEPADAVLLRLVEKVTDSAESVEPSDISLLRASGWSDEQIAETIHLTALFACFNRVVSAFGLPSQGMLNLYKEEVS